MLIKTAKGFTIVELLIVIIVIGILAGITIAVYIGVNNKAHDAAVQSDLQSSYKSVFLKFHKAAAMPKTSADLEVVGLKVSQGSYSTDSSYNFVYCPPYPYTTSREFAFIAASKSGKIFSYDSNGIKQYAGSWTMDDYADVCMDLLDTAGTFDRSTYSTSPEVWVTCGGYSEPGGGWRKWAGGELSSICAIY